MNKPIYIIAEAGVNHNGERDKAFQLVDAAVDAGADAVKFQTFKAEKLVTSYARKADYQCQATSADESQLDMLKRLELSKDLHHELMAYCVQKEIGFLSTAFDIDSLSFLVDVLELKILKIPSGEITNGPFLLSHALSGCDLIVSTGMSTLEEVKAALGVVAFGFLHGANDKITPSKQAFSSAFASEEGKNLLRKKVTLLHCTTEYPAPMRDINLNAMLTLRDCFGVPAGYSDHSEGISVPIAAAALGASIIEKHLTLDRNLPGPDHKASLEPLELKAMIDSIRTVEQVMGDGIKMPRSSELSNRDIARKSLVAARDIFSGEIYTADMIAVKRPGTGISPMTYWEMLGTEVVRDFAADEVIE